MKRGALERIWTVNVGTPDASKFEDASFAWNSEFEGFEKLGAGRSSFAMKEREVEIDMKLLD